MTRMFAKITNLKITPVKLPKSILAQKEITRELVFSSKQLIQKFRLEQKIFVHSKQIEQWDCDFGFVIPNSTNSWELLITAGDAVLPAEVISGHVVIETVFFDGPKALCKCKCRLFYV